MEEKEPATCPSKSAAWLFGLECFVVPLFLQKMCRPIFHRLKERQDSGGFHAVYSCIHPGLSKEKSQGVANRKPVFCTDHFTGVQEFVSCVWMVTAFEVHELGHYHGCKWSKTKPWWVNHQSLQPQLWCKLILWKFANASVKGLWLGLSAFICVLSCSLLEKCHSHQSAISEWNALVRIFVLSSLRLSLYELI